MSKEMYITQVHMPPAAPTTPTAPIVDMDIHPAADIAIVPVVDSSAAPAEAASTEEAAAAPPAPPAPRIWPVPTEEAIAAYHRVYQQAQLLLLETIFDPEMTAQSLSRANLALREAWQVWRQTAQPLSIIDANNFLRRTGANHLAEGRYGQGVAGMTIVAWEPGLAGSKLPVYGVRQSGQADDEAVDEIRQAWRRKTYEAWEHGLRRLQVMVGPADALRVAMQATLP